MTTCIKCPCTFQGKAVCVKGGYCERYILQFEKNPWCMNNQNIRVIHSFKWKQSKIHLSAFLVINNGPKWLLWMGSPSVSNKQDYHSTRQLISIRAFLVYGLLFWFSGPYLHSHQAFQLFSNKPTVHHLPSTNHPTKRHTVSNHSHNNLKRWWCRASRSHPFDQKFLLSLI